MQVTIGNHTGSSTYKIAYKHPDYVKWVLDQPNPIGQLLAIKLSLQNHLAAFNSKPLAEKCFGRNCSNLATRATVHRDNVSVPHFWCDNCNPYQTGAQSGRLQVVRTYEDMWRHVSNYCPQKLRSFNKLMKTISQAKGMGARATEARIQALFS